MQLDLAALPYVLTLIAYLIFNPNSNSANEGSTIILEKQASPDASLTNTLFYVFLMFKICNKLFEICQGPCYSMVVKNSNIKNKNHIRKQSLLKHSQLTDKVGHLAIAMNQRGVNQTSLVI